MVAPIKLEDFGTLHLRIRTLGYPLQGESIMISLMYGDNEFYNVITDCYDVDGYQYWINELPSNTRINSFIWTHPDEDHSLGVEQLLNKFDPDCVTKIFLPSSITKDLLQRNNKDSSIPTYEYLKERYNSRRKYQWNEVSLAEDEDPRFMERLRLLDTSSNNFLDFKIGFMAPIGAINNRRIDVTTMSSGQMNDLSLFYIIQFNRSRYIFAGDLAKQSIQFLDEDFLSNCRFVKIPHHGSKNPIKLVEKITSHPEMRLHSVTTVFGDTNPFDIVLDKYAEKSYGVYSTGRGEQPYGLVEIDYNIVNVNRFSVQLQGNAYQAR